MDSSSDYEKNHELQSLKSTFSAGNCNFFVSLCVIAIVDFEPSMTRKEYNHCVETYADGLFRFVLKNIRDDEKARDIVQETYTKVWVKVNEVGYEKSKAYLYKTAYNTMIDMIRKEQKVTRLQDHHQSQQSQMNSYSDVQEVLNEALKVLPEIQRTVVLLRDYEGYAYHEIGEITGLSEAQVKVYIFRARTALKHYIQKLELVLEDH